MINGLFKPRYDLDHIKTYIEKGKLLFIWIPRVQTIPFKSINVYSMHQKFSCTLIDLTHALSETTPLWNGKHHFVITFKDGPITIFPYQEKIQKSALAHAAPMSLLLDFQHIKLYKALINGLPGTIEPDSMHSGHDYGTACFIIYKKNPNCSHHMTL